MAAIGEAKETDGVAEPMLSAAAVYRRSSNGEAMMKEERKEKLIRRIIRAQALVVRSEDELDEFLDCDRFGETSQTETWTTVNQQMP